MYKFECDNCKQNFTRKYNKTKCQKNIFCSKKCSHEYGRTSFVCVHCGKNKTKNKSDTKIFCSSSCSVTFNNLKKSEGKKYFCVWCNTFISNSWIPPRSLCLTCKQKREYGSVYDDISLSDLKIKYPSLSTFHSVLRANSRRVFKISNQDKACKICGYDKFVNICHIKDVKDFDKNSLISEVNHIDNLIALCPNHHWEFDHNLLKL